MRRLGMITSFVAAVYACTSADTGDREPPGPAPPPPTAAPPSPPEAPSQVDPIGPSRDPSATPEQRKEAVLAVLRGEVPQDRFLLRPTDPGKDVDPYLVDELSPLGPRPVPKVRQGKAKVDGKLDADIIRRIVRRHRNEVRKCYWAALENDPELAGEVIIEIVIPTGGKPVSASLVSSSLEDETVGPCVVNEAGKWVFPRSPADPPQPTTVRVPFTFSSGT